MKESRALWQLFDRAASLRPCFTYMYDSERRQGCFGTPFRDMHGAAPGLETKSTALDPCSIGNINIPRAITWTHVS